MLSKSMSGPPAGSRLVPKGMSTKHRGRSLIGSPGQRAQPASGRPAGGKAVGGSLWSPGPAGKSSIRCLRPAEAGLDLLQGGVAGVAAQGLEKEAAGFEAPAGPRQRDGVEARHLAVVRAKTVSRIAVVDRRAGFAQGQ